MISVISFVETKLFTRLIQDYLSDDEYSKLQQELVADPQMVRATAARNVGQEILDGLREIKRGDVGRIVTVPPVATIREQTGLSQSKFAALLGVSVRTLQEWEQGRRAPSGAARTLLMVAARNPQVLIEVA